MTGTYDKHYQTENLFGQACPELLAFFEQYPQKGKVLDLGCGQGRDAIPLARLGFEVTGIDSSKVGIEQMTMVAEQEGLSLQGDLTDIYAYSDFDPYDFVLLDSMFHFEKKDRVKETAFIERIIHSVKPGCIVVFSIQDSKSRVSVLNSIIDAMETTNPIADESFVYWFEPQDGGQRMEMPYRLIAVEKSVAL